MADLHTAPNLLHIRVIGQPGSLLLSGIPHTRTIPTLAVARI